jgi:16S rRNA (uracil1498-N3)-methyltransferase
VLRGEYRFMKLRRFKILKENIRGREAVLEDPAEIRHLTKVLRLKSGDSVILFDGEGKEFQAQIKTFSPQRILFAIDRESDRESLESPLEIILGIGILKATKLDWLVQKTTELGISEILPFHSLRVIPRPEELAAQTRLTRWQKIAAEAAKQCGRSKVPKIHPPCSFAEALRSFPGSSRIFLWEKEKDRTLPNPICSSRSAFFALVGPEGGFSEEEAKQAEGAGFSPVCLGPRILRAETAGLVIVSLLQFLGGDLH